MIPLFVFILKLLWELFCGGKQFWSHDVVWHVVESFVKAVSARSRSFCTNQQQFYLLRSFFNFPTTSSHNYIYFPFKLTALEIQNYNTTWSPCFFWSCDSCVHMRQPANLIIYTRIAPCTTLFTMRWQLHVNLLLHVQSCKFLNNNILMYLPQ